ncbi:16S rRNA (uracil(1498)-N(3))-methyltransferase [Sulfurimonas sp.]|uniref:16S rRNA (uracil(1498)-N(3))-methyltransferase n=1 Tax=Sulfurimonas sp. TaxID=2022749 RepID=UPI00356A6AAF
MIYIFDENAGDDVLVLKGELFKYIIKVRRHSEGDMIAFRDEDNIKILHTYKLDSIEPKKAVLSLQDSKELEVKAKKDLHIGWCKIDSKSIEKVLPSLSEIGVNKITFIDCKRSQRNIKLDFKRFDRILHASMQQCGSTQKIEFELCDSLEKFLKQYPNAKVFDFVEKTLDEVENISTVIIGCEGGFSSDEKELLSSQEVFRLDTPMVLRSESAVMAVASKVLL